MDQVLVIMSILTSGSTLAVNLYLYRQARKGNRKGRGRHRK